MATTNDQSSETINDLNLDALFSTIDAVDDDHELGEVTFRAETVWTGGVACETRVSDFDHAGETVDSPEFVIEGDEPKELLGQRSAPNPAELLLAALGSCLTVSYAAHGAALGVQLESLRFEFEGDIDLRGFLGLSEEVRNGFDEIEVTTYLEADGTEEELEELRDAAEGASSIMDNVTNAVTVSTELVTK
ncbi:MULTISPECIES: OsmC family protein [unclassified Haladaptatus]|uniref:OsmC family protein n=1 Tax=unclassified Haladaptatus TaxID=2622732 RepID=UPI0023E81C05|nr:MULTISPECIES: OsmC family protein [unclassified Haladaptatus]